jgi:hypothetical protein
MNINFTNGDYCRSSFPVKLLLAKTGENEIFAILNYSTILDFSQIEQLSLGYILKDLSETLLDVKIHLMHLEYSGKTQKVLELPVPTAISLNILNFCPKHQKTIFFKLIQLSYLKISAALAVKSLRSRKLSLAAILNYSVI